MHFTGLDASIGRFDSFIQLMSVPLSMVFIVRVSSRLQEGRYCVHDRRQCATRVVHVDPVVSVHSHSAAPGRRIEELQPLRIEKHVGALRSGATLVIAVAPEEQNRLREGR